MSQEFDKYEKLGAYHWDWYGDPNYVWYRECVDRCVEFCKGVTLDIGCGDGVVLSKLPKGSQGLDKSGFGIDQAPTDNWCLNVDLNNYIHRGITDYVCCLNTIEHLETPAAVVGAVARARKGAIIITDKPIAGRKGRYHEHEYTKKELLDTFKEFKPKYFEIKSTEFGKPITFHGVEILK